MATARERLLGLQNVELAKARRALNALADIAQQGLSLVDSTLLDAAARQQAAANFQSSCAGLRQTLVAAAQALPTDFNSYEPPAGGSV